MKKRVCMASRLCPRCGNRNVNHRGQPCAVTGAMLKALHEFARYEGRTWKHRLRMAWLRNDVMSQELQAVRNIIGPYRIDKVRL